MRSNVAEASAGWRGTWAMPQALAGEFAKGIHPGPKTSSAGVGPVPHRNTGCNDQSVNMRTNFTSRAETVQHNRGRSSKMCWHGLHCWRQRCPYQHPEPRPAQWGVGKSAGRGGQETPMGWGGRGIPMPAPQPLSWQKGGGKGKGRGYSPQNTNGEGPRLRSPVGAGPQVGRPQHPFVPPAPQYHGVGATPPPNRHKWRVGLRVPGPLSPSLPQKGEGGTTLAFCQAQRMHGHRWGGGGRVARGGQEGCRRARV